MLVQDPHEPIALTPTFTGEELVNDLRAGDFRVDVRLGQCGN